MCDGGRDRLCQELVEYCDNLFLEACDIGRGRVDLLFGFGGDVIKGGRGGWFGLDPGDDTAGGEELVAGEDVGDMTAVILGLDGQDTASVNDSCAYVSTSFRLIYRSVLRATPCYRL